MKSGVSINSWEDVNKALKLKGECELTLDTLEAEMNMKINDVKSNKTWIDWAEIVNGGFIEYKADNKANKKWGL